VGPLAPVGTQDGGQLAGVEMDRVGNTHLIDLRRVYPAMGEPTAPRPMFQTTNRPRAGGHSWSLMVTGGQFDRGSGSEKPRKHGDLAKTSRSFTRQRPQVRALYRPPREIADRAAISGHCGSVCVMHCVIQGSAQTTNGPQTSVRRTVVLVVSSVGPGPGFESLTAHHLILGQTPAAVRGGGFSSLPPRDRARGCRRRATLESMLEVGVSKFVVLPLDEPAHWHEELEEAAAEILVMQN
jgi:hypothetical protein